MHGLMWVFVVLLGGVVATAIALAMEMGWVRPDSFYIVGGMIWPLATYTTSRFALWAARNLYEKSESFRDMIDRFWGWVTSRPDAIWAFITSRWLRWTLLVLLVTAGVYAVRNYEVRYALWPVVVLGPAAVLSALLKGRREKKGIRWVVSRIFPWIGYPVLLFFFSAEPFWSAVEPTLDRLATETWLIWPLSFAFGVVLTLTIRAWNRAARDHKVAWYHGLWIVPLSSALMRWVGFELVLNQVNLALVLSGAAAVWAVLGIAFGHWVIFSRFWTVNPLYEMGLVDAQGNILANESMALTTFRLPVSRFAAVLQLLFHMHPQAKRTEYLPLLDPTVGRRDGIVVISVGIAYARGETPETFADYKRISDSIAIRTKSRIPLVPSGIVFFNKMRKQMRNPSGDSLPSMIAKLFGIAHVYFQDADLGKDIEVNLPIRGVDNMRAKFKGEWLKGEEAWARVWNALVKAADDLDKKGLTFIQAEQRSIYTGVHGTPRQGGRRQVPFR